MIETYIGGAKNKAGTLKKVPNENQHVEYILVYSETNYSGTQLKTTEKWEVFEDYKKRNIFNQNK